MYSEAPRASGGGPGGGSLASPYARGSGTSPGRSRWSGLERDDGGGGGGGKIEAWDAGKARNKGGRDSRARDVSPARDAMLRAPQRLSPVEHPAPPADPPAPAKGPPRLVGGAEALAQRRGIANVASSPVDHS
ncbi:hypothetical protein T484DRAFT_1876327 [Baffinella frigidus]|nr:hypothetical protein T484DRAFT_1876327 [Cryptophyta sp. CCMP2293]